MPSFNLILRASASLGNDLGILGDKIICDLDKTPDLSQRSPQNCPKCGNPVYDPGNNSSQSPPQISNHYCCGCGNPLEGIFCHQCTYKICGNSAHYGHNCSPKVLILPDPEPFNNHTIKELLPTVQSFDPKSDLVYNSPNVFSQSLQPSIYSYEFCGNDAYYGQDCSLQIPFTYDLEPCYNQDFNFPQNFQTFQQYPCCTHCGGPHETYSCDSYGNDSHFGYDCQPQFPLNYESEPSYIENYNSYPYDSSSVPQQYPCCTCCGGPHETCQCDQLIFDEPYCKHYRGPHMNFQCHPMNQNSYNSNSLGFDQPQPSQFPVIHQPPQEMSIQELEDLRQQYLDEMKSLINSEYRDEIKIAELKQNLNVTPSLSTKEPDNSLSMGDEHLDTILESEEFIKSSVENLISIPSESEGNPDNMCDVPFHDNSPPLDVSKDQFEDISDSTNKFSSTDDDSFYIDNIDYVEASPPDSELVSSEVMEIVILEVEGINDDILLTIKDDILREKLLNINLLIAKIEALNDNPTPSSDFMTKVDCFFFKIEPNSGDFTMDVVKDISPTREPRVHNALPTHPTLQLNLKFQPSSESLFTYVVWIFLPFLLYSIVPQYLLSLRNEDTIFDPDICTYHFFFF
nr:hypothetical protein [Tanacetum cinerariifolium]